MASKKAPAKKPPIGEPKVGSKAKGYLDQGARTALGKVDWKGVGRLTESMGSQGPKKPKSKATTKKKAQPKIYMPVAGGGSRVVGGRIPRGKKPAIALTTILFPSSGGKK
jgi:hypothetical protein